uniref:Uncharacterized protein n=1 Tax=Ciona savignyi TaxID=51511 RepID=H2ZEN3_CIOSA
MLFRQRSLRRILFSYNYIKPEENFTIGRFHEICSQPKKIIVTSTTREKRRKSRQNIHFTSGWKRQVSLNDLFKAGVVTESTVTKIETGELEQADVEKSLKLYLVGEEPIAGLIMSDTGEKISIYNAWKQGLIRRGTSISLLEAQAATGRVIDVETADKLSVKEASERGVIDGQFETILSRAERAVYGYTTRTSPDTLSLFEAMKRGLMVENHGV